MISHSDTIGYKENIVKIASYRWVGMQLLQVFFFVLVGLAGSVLES